MAHDLAALIRFHRKRSGLTQQALAELAGLCINQVNEKDACKTTVRW